MTTFKHLRRFVPRSFCVRSSGAVALNNTPDLVSKPKLSDVLPVQTLDHTTQKGDHYQRSYRQFTSLLNSGGHAEVFEGCVVVGKVVKVINKEVIETQSSVKELVALQYKIDKLLERRSSGQYPEQVARIEEEIAQKQEQLRKLANQSDLASASEGTHRLFENDWNIENVLVVDWGHKHLGYAPLDRHQVCPGHSEYVACRLHKFEMTALALGHPVHERHNEAQLEYIKPARQGEATETPSLRSLMKNTVFPNIYTNRDISPPLSNVYIDHSYTNHFTENAIFKHIRSSSEADVSWFLEDDMGIDGKLRIRIKSESLEHIYAAISMINHEIKVYENNMDHDRLEKVETPEKTSLSDEKTEGVTQVLETLQDFDNICVNKGAVKTTMKTLLIYVDTAHTMHLIGKERPNIYSIGKNSKTFLKLISDGEVETEEKRKIRIKGKDKDAIFVAIDMINKHMDEYKKQETIRNTQRSKDPLKDLQAEDSATTNAAQLIELQDYEHVYVDRNNISSRLTGSHIQISHIFVDDCYISPVMENKKSLIRNLSKSSLIVLSESDVPAGMAKIQIRSRVKNMISLAAGVVNKHIEMYENSGEKKDVIPRRELGDSLDPLEGHSFIYIDKESLVPRSVEVKAQDIYIDKHYVALVIGRKGATINKLREKSHALVDVGSTFLEKKQKITISSENEEDISVAVGLINDKISQFVQKQK